MGEVVRVLHTQTLERRAPDHYAGKGTFELSESFHVHRRNLRLEMTTDEWCAFVRHAGSALATWSGEDPRPGRATTYLGGVRDIPPEPGISPDRFDVEICRYPTIPEGTVHVHYRDLRIEFSPAEFKEFSDGIIAARRTWES